MNESQLSDVVDHLDEIARLMAFDDETSHWQQSSYSDASEVLDGKSPDVLEDPEQVDGIGSSIGGTIEQFLEEGDSDRLQSLRERNTDLVELTRVEGIGPKTARRIHDALGVENLEDLEEAAESDELTEVERIGSTTQENILEEIGEVRAGAQERKDYDDVVSYWEGLRARLDVMSRRDTIGRFEPAGSFRRKKDTVGDLDVIVESDDPEGVFGNLERWRPVDKVLERGETKMSFRVDALQIDIRVVPPEEYGACLLYFSGNTEHNIAMRERAIKKGLKLSEYGLFDADDETRVECSTEREIYNALGYEYLDPEDRQPENLTDL